MTNQVRLVMACILIVIAGLLVLNPSTITIVQAQMYSYDYGYDKDEKKSDVNIQKIKCVNRNINVNGIDITQIPQDTTAASELQPNDQGSNEAQNGNELGDLNFDRNLVNICANANFNQQIKIKIGPPVIPETNLDLAVANFGDDDVSILLGTGTGSFNPVIPTEDVGNEPFYVVVGDFNGDTLLDLAVANRADNNVSILLGIGDGTFVTPAPTYAVGDSPRSIAVGSFNPNTDNFLDLAVANSGDASVSILLGVGDGTFTPATPLTVEVGGGPESVAVGLFNSDNLLDLAVAEANVDKLAIFLGTGTGDLFDEATPATVAVGDGPIFVVVGSFNPNTDNFLDLAVANANADTISILFGDGDGTFDSLAQETINVGDVPAAIAVGLFNGDSFLDLAVANAGVDNISILLGTGTGPFNPATPATVTVGNGPASIAVGLFDGDSFVDLAVVIQSSNSVSILFGDGDGTFDTKTQETIDVGLQPVRIAVGEFDGL